MTNRGLSLALGVLVAIAIVLMAILIGMKRHHQSADQEILIQRVK